MDVQTSTPGATVSVGSPYNHNKTGSIVVSRSSITTYGRTSKRGASENVGIPYKDNGRVRHPTLGAGRRRFASLP
jgi:hypothetical protein